MSLKSDVPVSYCIQVNGAMGERWARYFGDVAIEQAGAPDSPITVLTGCAQDQAALIGIVNALYSLGLELLYCECKYSDE